jgi:hypothetical protein
MPTSKIHIINSNVRKKVIPVGKNMRISTACSTDQSSLMPE